MNTFNCSEGWASDDVFIYDGAPGRCDMPVAAWIFLGAVIVVGKAFVVYKQVTLWLRRARRMRHTAMNSNRTLIPFVPTLGIASFFIYTTFFVTTSLNVSNSTNGWAAGLYSMGWLVFGSMSIFYFLKMLRLGKKLIPLSKKVMTTPTTSSGNTGEAAVRDLVHTADLGKFDAFGRILFFVELASVVGQTVLFLIVGVAIDHSFTVVLAGFGVMALFLFVHTLSVLWLMERTINAIKKSQFKAGSSGSNGSGTHSGQNQHGMRSDIRAILRKMREQQLIIILLASTGGVVYVLIVSLAIPTAWYVILIHMYYDLVANLVIVFSMGRRSGGRNNNHQHRSPHNADIRGPGAVGGMDDTFTTKDERTTNRVEGRAGMDFSSTLFGSPTGKRISQSRKLEDEPKSDHFVMVFQSTVDGQPNDDDA